MKKYLLVFGMAASLFGCDTKEKTRLQVKVDSLSYELNQSQKAQKAMNEIGVLLDSIDASRHMLNSNIREGITYSDYIQRLELINTHIKNSESKIAELEKNLKTSKGVSSATIHRLKQDLELKSKEYLALQLDVANLREENRNLSKNINMRDSVISGRDEMIKMKNADVASLEGLIKDINEQNRIKVAGLYFAQAQALEVAANRTKFAPRKKKETRREALELYKLSSAMGNTEADAKIHELEKKIS